MEKAIIDMGTVSFLAHFYKMS